MKKNLFLFVLVCLPLLANAYDVEINGIYYNVNPKAKYAEVTKGEDVYYGDIIIPSSISYDGATYPVTKICDEAFNHSNIRNKDLTSIIIPNSITEIGYAAFTSCDKLTDLIIPNSVKKIGQNAFSGCNGLIKVEFPNSVEEIGTYALYHCNNLVEVTLPNSIKEIPSNMFYECNNLTTVIIPDGIIEIGDYAFRRCYKLTDLIIPNSMRRIGKEAFRECDGLIKVEIPSGVVEMGNYIFYECDNLTEVTLPNSVKEIPFGMFGQCRNLTKVIISDSIITIDAYAFSGCIGLTKIVIPNSVTTVAYGTFEGCSALKTVVIGSGVNNIGFETFKNCPKLEDVYIYVTTAPSKYYNYDISNMFEGSYIEYATLHVPKAGIDSYKNTVPWSGFGSIVAIPQEYSLTYIVDGVVYKTYEIMQGTPINPEAEPTKEGYTFSGWSDIPDIMPDDNVIIMGSFTPNKYILTYVVDGITYNTSEVIYGTKLSADNTPTKEGYTFVANDEIPQTMPAHDVTITGSFVVNTYTVTYVIDGETYKTVEVEYGADIQQENAPTKEGYTFAGWSDMPETMPAHDIAVTGSFTVNTYMVTYLLDGEVYKTESVEYGAEIVPIEVPHKEGYVFNGWNNMPETMPAHDVVVYGSYSIDTGIVDAVTDGEGAYGIYTVDGIRRDALRKGLNIIRTEDGKTRKVYVK